LKSRVEKNEKVKGGTMTFWSYLDVNPGWGLLYLVVISLTILGSVRFAVNRVTYLVKEKELSSTPLSKLAETMEAVLFLTETAQQATKASVEPADRNQAVSEE